jgi:hypothetical protein
MRGGLLEHIARIDLGPPDREVRVDSVGPGGARRHSASTMASSTVTPPTCSTRYISYPWLEIECSRCKAKRDVDLAALRHPSTTFVHDLASRLRYRKCARDAANGAHHVLGDVGTGERSTKLLRQLQPDDGQDFVETFEDAGRYSGPLLVGSTREIADQLFSLVGVIKLPGLAQHSTGGRMLLFRQAFQ